jgi:hypothetical protein
MIVSCGQLTRYRGEGFGEGPTRGTFVAAAKHLLATQAKANLWQDMNGFLVPKLSPLQDADQSSERVLEFRLAGTFFALYTMIMRSPITKVSPHVLLLLLCRACPPDAKYLRSADPNSASILAPWFAFTDEESPSTETSTRAAVRHLLAEYLGDQVCAL